MNTPKAGSRTYLADDPRNIDFQGFDSVVRVMQVIVVALAKGLRYRPASDFSVPLVVFSYAKTIHCNRRNK